MTVIVDWSCDKIIDIEYLLFFYLIQSVFILQHEPACEQDAEV